MSIHNIYVCEEIRKIFILFGKRSTLSGGAVDFHFFIKATKVFKSFVNPCPAEPGYTLPL